MRNTLGIPVSTQFYMTDRTIDSKLVRNDLLD